jgi:Flp pilus assembly protein CpaB
VAGTLPPRPRPSRFGTRPRLPRPSALLVVVVAAATGLTAFQLTEDAVAARDRLGRMEPVVVLRADVPAGAALGPADATIESRPASMVPAGALSSVPTDAVLRADAYAGEVLVHDRLGALAPGERGVAVPVPPGLGLRAGDRVDVRATLDATAPVARGARVLSVADDTAVVAVAEREALAVSAALAVATVTLVLVP